MIDGNYQCIGDDLRGYFVEPKYPTGQAWIVPGTYRDDPVNISPPPPTKSLHFSMSEPEAFHGETQRYVMFSFFSFRGGELNIGQCQSVREEEVADYRGHMERHGWTKASYRYVNGKPVLVQD